MSIQQMIKIVVNLNGKKFNTILVCVANCGIWIHNHVLKNHVLY